MVWEDVKVYKEIHKCRVCGNTNLKPIVDLGRQFLTGIFPEVSQEVDEGPLELVKCLPDENNLSVCGLVQLKHSFENTKMYGENYGYRSGLNQSMVRHLSEITQEIKQQIKLCENDLVIDIGSNDGTLLKSYGIDNLDYVGMDPTGTKFKKFYPEYITLIPDFFSAGNIINIRGKRKAKVITSIAMFYDLEDPVKFANEVAQVLSEDGIWVMEQSYLPSMLQTNSYDTICHEHLEFYCLSQIEWIVKAAGMKVINVSLNDSNGGSFRVTIAKQGTDYKESKSVEFLRQYESNQEMNTLQTYVRFNQSIVNHRKDILNFLAKVHADGKRVYGYGASTKGNVFLQYCGITPRDIVAIAEVNEDKFGHVTPGTCIPIVSEKEAKSENPDYFIVLPWHFKKNILEKEKDYILKNKCKFVFPLPELEVIDSENVEENLR